METAFGVWLPQLTIHRCRRMEDAAQIVQAVRDRHCVVVQVDNLEPQEAQRILDFAAGGVEALDGRVERVGESTFLFAPAGVEVSRG